MGDEHGLSALTRSLMLGASVGAIVLTQVGCQPQQRQQSVDVSAEPQGPVAALPAGEAILCAAALESKRPADVDAVLLQYPNSRCVKPLLGAMPASTLSALSPAAVRNLPESAVRQLAPNVLRNLPPVPSVQHATGALQSNGSGGGGGGGGGGGY